MYKIKIKTSAGTIFQVKVKDNPNIHIFYKKQSTREENLKKTQEWIKSLTSYERTKFNEMKKKKNDEPDINKKRQISKEFYNWINARHPNKNDQLR